jgi:hypothetical protein
MARRFIAFLCILGAVLQYVSAQSGVIDYVLVVTEEVISPACSPRLSLVINGTLPGPEIHVNAGQHVHIRYQWCFELS